MKLADFFCSGEIQRSDKSKWDFQEDAVGSVILDLKENPNAKKLIVIPTGGGKTVVALQLINRLIAEGFVTQEKKVLWTVHSIYLKTQTKEYLTHARHSKLRDKIKLIPNISDYLDIEMIGEATNILNDHRRLNYVLLIIDEAHHASAPSYRNFFSYHLGIVGLTATPIRLDRKELPFTGIAYSVKFSTLEKLGVITMPVRQNISTDLVVDSEDLDRAKEINKFDTPERNQFIADWIFSKRRAFKYKKLVIFTGSKSHAQNLYKEIKSANDYYNNPFEHVGYVLGGDINDQPGKKNDEYLEEEKERGTSILINCQVLTEGYDDPNLDTVIMATPSNSTVYYMQCMGRVVRVPENDDENKRAYLFEFVDKLPNISYRVDNRWLYGEIEQELMPIIPEDIVYRSKSELHIQLLELYKEYNILNNYHEASFNIVDDDFGLLLFTDSGDPDSARWFPLLIDNSERGKLYADAFNKLSLSIDRHAHYGPGNSVKDDGGEYIIHTVLGIEKSDALFSQRLFSESFIYSLARASFLKKNRQTVDCLKYYTFRKIKPRSLLCRIWQYLKSIIN